MSALKPNQVTVFDRARNYTFFFYLLGQNSCNPHQSAARNCSKFTNAIPSIVSILSNLLIAVIGIIYRYNYDGFYEQTDSVVTYVLLVLQFITNLMMMLQSICYASDIRAIYDKVESVRARATENMRHLIEYEQFDRQYRRSAITVATIYCASLAIKFYFTSAKTHIMVQSAQMLLLGYSLTDNVHTLFYIQLFLFLLASTTSCARGQANRSDRQCSRLVASVQMYEHALLLANLRYIKRVHYILFDISLLINKRFGWGLVALLVMNFVEVAYSSYWIFLYTNDYYSHLFISNFLYYIMCLFVMFIVCSFMSFSCRFGTHSIALYGLVQPTFCPAGHFCLNSLPQQYHLPAHRIVRGWPCTHSGTRRGNSCNESGSVATLPATRVPHSRPELL